MVGFILLIVYIFKSTIVILFTDLFKWRMVKYKDTTKALELLKMKTAVVFNVVLHKFVSMAKQLNPKKG